VVFLYMNLCRFERPSRYINREVNAVYRTAPVRVALAFPDIYDVGMSHLGLRILYSLINNLPYASAERVFSPWTDMEAAMRTTGTQLSSLETKRPLREFDIVGFSLQYELCYTTVLNMLDLAGIPMRSGERREKDPLIIAGGPCTVNPLPLSSFIDAFLIGDGESAVTEILETVYDWKSGGDGKRDSLLGKLAGMKGIYVPAVHGLTPKDSPIERRYVSSLDDAPYPVYPVVPYTSIVHDRVTVELSRGCTRGCRFCQAGMIYRPLRERSPQSVLGIVDASLKSTGHEEVSLTSLSAGDYPYLLPLVKELNRRLSGKVVSLSLPSLRVAAVNQEVLKEIKTVRKTGFTMAPEAATDRLRMVINKDFAEEDYDRALHALFAEGWETIKLYFMIGLPTERDEDVEAIPEMAQRALRTAKRYTRRYVNVNVGISPFVPKPHTPLQWCGQEEREKIREKMEYLKLNLSKRKITYKGHNPSMSLLEALFSRGGQDLSDLIEKAWALGCRLDAWTECFDFMKWIAAAEKTGIDIHARPQKDYGGGDRLPWDGIDVGVKKEFLWGELQEALSCRKTADCQKGCHGCGLGCETTGTGHETAVGGQELPGVERSLVQSPHRMRPVRMRVQFSKTGVMRYLSHRELMTVFIRAMRRAEIPLQYSQGFHPSPRVSFGPPLNVGVSGLKEYFDLEIEPAFALSDVRNRMNSVLPAGLLIGETGLIPVDEPSLDSFVSRYEYEITCPDAGVIEDFLVKRSVVVEREKANRKTVAVDIRQMVSEAWIGDDTTVRIVAIDNADGKVRIGELLREVFHMPAEELGITRVSMHGWRAGWLEPLASVYHAADEESRKACIGREGEGARGENSVSPAH